MRKRRKKAIAQVGINFAEDMFHEIYKFCHWIDLREFRLVSESHFKIISPILIKQTRNLLEKIPKLCVGVRLRSNNNNKKKEMRIKKLCSHKRKDAVCYPHYFIPLFSNLEVADENWNLVNKSKLTLCSTTSNKDYGLNIIQRSTLYKTTALVFRMIPGIIAGTKKVKRRWNKNPKWLTSKFLRTTKCKYDLTKKEMGENDEDVKWKVFKWLLQSLIEEMRRYLNDDYNQMRQYIRWVNEIDGGRKDLFQYVFSEMMKNVQEFEKRLIVNLYTKKVSFRTLMESDERLEKIRDEIGLMTDLFIQSNKKYK